MNETPVPSHPFHYSIPADSFDPVREGIGVGVKSAVALASVYAVGVPLFYFTMMRQGYPFSSVPLRDVREVISNIVSIYNGALALMFLSLVVELIPAVVVGFISGGIIGKIFRHRIKVQLALRQAVQYGFWISFILFGL